MLFSFCVQPCDTLTRHRLLLLCISLLSIFLRFILILFYFLLKSAISLTCFPNTTLLHLCFFFVLLLLCAGPVCAGGHGQPGGRAGQVEGKSSPSLGGTSSRKRLCPQSVPAVSSVSSPQQLNQGNPVRFFLFL